MKTWEQYKKEIIEGPLAELRALGLCVLAIAAMCGCSRPLELRQSTLYQHLSSNLEMQLDPPRPLGGNSFIILCGVDGTGCEMYPEPESHIAPETAKNPRVL